MADMIFKMDKKVKVQIPSVPNFIKVDDNYRSVTEFSEAQLKQIAELWTKRLLQRAQRKPKRKGGGDE